VATRPEGLSCPSDDPTACLIAKLSLRDRVSDKEMGVLASAIEAVESLPAGTVLVRAGETLSRSILLVDGLVARFKDMADGGRQITELHVAGDFLDLHGFLLKRLEHDVGALSAVRVAYVPHHRLRTITESEPHLARLLWLSTLIDTEILREWTLSMGRRSAIARIAHLVCELKVRLQMVGLGNGSSLPLPITQADVGDATGLTSVHVNRMLRALRDEGVLTWRGGEAIIHDWDRLQHLAEFDPSYLYSACEPR
jgi:CRP-like cAMP-binding protein